MKIKTKLILGISLFLLVAYVAWQHYLSTDKAAVVATPEVTPVFQEEIVVKKGSIAGVVESAYLAGVTTAIDVTTITLASKGVPDHNTAYWGVGNDLYIEQAEDKTVTPDTLQEQSFLMTIPVFPRSSIVSEKTSLGPIGMALNGVAIYNDHETEDVALTQEVLATIDDHGGHSGPGGLYHYHFSDLAAAEDSAVLVGFLRDGFPIYSSTDEGGVLPELDSFGGHIGVTPEFPEGIYHYHAAATGYLESDYHVLKSGSYYGVKGDFTW